MATEESPYYHANCQIDLDPHEPPRISEIGSLFRRVQNPPRSGFGNSFGKKQAGSVVHDPGAGAGHPTFPQLTDITDSTDIHFDHLSSPGQRYIVESMSGGVAFGDYDRDGWPDLFVAHYVDFHLDDLPKFGSEVNCQYHGIPVQCGPRGLKGSPDNLYRNNGDGTFTDVSARSGAGDPAGRFGLTAVWCDFDNDGALDLFVANDGEPNYLYRNDGNGQFTDIAYQAGVAVNQDGNDQANMGIAPGDYLHTGRFSVAITHFSDEYAAVFHNDGSMNFTDVSYPCGIARSTTRYVGWGDAFFDFDNDGWLDFFMVNGHVYPQVDSGNVGTQYREPKLLFLNQRDWTFRNFSKLAGPAIQIPQVSRGLAVGDLFNDGRLELVVENLQGQPMILRPEGGAQNHWIGVELQGTKSNRLALNARVKAVAGDLIQTGEVFSGGSYL